MKINTSKLIIGTANLYTRYGNKPIFLNNTKSKKILNYAKNKKIKILDISTDYHSYKKLINKYNFKNWKISFKISSEKVNQFKSSKDIVRFFDKVLKQFNKKKIEYVLFHNSKDMYSKKGNLIFRVLVNLKKRKKVGKIGVSVYDTNEIFNIIKRNKIDIIQAPFNIFDQRINSENLIVKLNARKIKIHARSIFLQGLLVDQNLIPRKLSKKMKKNSWYKLFKNKDFNPASEALNFVSRKKFIDKIIISVRSVNQFKDLLNSEAKTKITNFNQFKIKNIKLIDPRKW